MNADAEREVELMDEQPEDAEADLVSSEEEKAEAAEMGWVDKDAFRGDGGAQWRTAKEFLERGRDLLPIVQKNSERFKSQLDAERAERQRLEAELRAQSTSLKAIRDAQEEDAEVTAAAREAELNDELEQAIEAGDHKEQARIQKQLVEVAVAKRMATKPSEPPAGNEPPKIDPVAQEFLNDNPWFVGDVAKEAGQKGKDLRRTRMLNMVVAEMRIAGDKRYGREFLDAALAEVDKTLGTRNSPDRGRANKVEESRGGGTSGGGSGKSGRYSDLPPEAKRQCDMDAKSLVGPSKRHKTLDSYRSTYAKIYFEE